MTLKKMYQVVNSLLKKYPPDTEVWLDDENVMVVANGKREHFNPDDVLMMENDAQIVWDGISAVRAWNKAGKQRIYFRCVGVPEGAHRSGKVFLELVNGSWMPNMRYQLMVSLASQLDEAGLFSAEEVADKYRDFVENK